MSRRDDRDPAVYARLRYAKAAERARQDRKRFDPTPPGDDDWTVPDRTGLVKLTSGPEPLGAVLGDITSDRRWADRLRGLSVFDRWAEVVGADVARHCQPVRLAGGILTVEAASSSWATQLKYLSGTIALKVNQALGEPVVTEVVVTVSRRS